MRPGSRGASVAIAGATAAAVAAGLVLAWPSDAPAITTGASAPETRALEPGGATPEETAVDAAPRRADCARPEAPLARVGARSMTTGEVCALLGAMFGTHGPARLAEHGPRLVDRLVEGEVVRAALAEVGMSLSEGEVAAELARLGVADAVASEALIAEVRLELGKERLLARRPSPAVTDEQIEDEYRRASREWGARASAHVEGWLARVRPGAAADEGARARAALEALAGMLAKGEAPAQPPAGIEAMAPFVLSETGHEPALEAAVFAEGPAQAPGAWSEPLRTKVGWMLARASDVRPGEALPLAEVAGRIRQALEGRRRAAAERAMMDELRAGAEIEVLAIW